MKTYSIKKIRNFDENAWDAANVLELDCSPWEAVPRLYDTQARLVYTDEAIYIKMSTNETQLRAVNTQRDSDVCEDSCMEFFLSPNENDPRYLNFEINPIGAMLLFIGRGRDMWQSVDVSEEIFDIKTVITNKGWSVCYKIPFSFLNSLFGTVTPTMRANFYKCGEKTVKSHYGCWNPILMEEMEFHCPQYFGKLILEEN